MTPPRPGPAPAEPVPAGPATAGPGDPVGTEDVTVVLRVEQAGGPVRTLPLQGRWHRAEDGVLRFEVDGEIDAEAVRIRVAGWVRVWPRWAFGSVVGMHRIALDVLVGAQRLQLDGDVRPPPYFRGVTLPGRIRGRHHDRAVQVSIDPVQLVVLWVVLNSGDLPRAPQR